MSLPLRIAGSQLAGILASALLLGLYARGFWPLGFVALVPWLLTLPSLRWRGAMASGAAMSMAFSAAVFGWFGVAVGEFTGIGNAAGTVLLIALAPLLQPQFIAYAVAMPALDRRFNAPLACLGAACVWIACEWWWPKLLGDSLGHGMAPAMYLRQTADLGGVAAVTWLLLIANAASAYALRAVRSWRSAARWIGLAVAIPCLMWGYGHWRLTQLKAVFADEVPWIRIGMVQANLVDYEGRRQSFGTYGVVRRVLDTHFQLSLDAIAQHGAEALLWSETVYPTTFGQPRSSDGEAFDTEIRDFVASTGVPLLFGTYERDASGEYNAAVLLEPGATVGAYRKTHPFPLTEHVPAWLDYPWLRAALPWAGTWQRGDGARLLPLRAPGRELQIAPLICLDDVRPQLAIDGARLGAQALVSLSNDAWFSSDGNGARLHLWVASFRSIETRLPQLRVTTNGLTAFVDPSGEVLASAAQGDQAVLGGAVPIRNPPLTLMVRWGDWAGGAATLVLLMLGAAMWWPKRRPYTPQMHGALVPTAWRWAIASLRALAAAGLLWLLLAMLRDGFSVYSIKQLQFYAGAVVLPLMAAWAVRRWCAFAARIDGGLLVLQQRTQRIEIPLQSLAMLRPWRWPMPMPGLDLVLSSGRRFSLATPDPLAITEAISTVAPKAAVDASSVASFARHRAAAGHRWLDSALVKFALFPLLPALIAFRLHQIIAFGGTFGEYYTFGLAAYLSGLSIWWASWSLGLMVYAATLRVVGEALMPIVQAAGPRQAAPARNAIEWLLRLGFYLGVPAWLLARLLFN